MGKWHVEHDKVIALFLKELNTVSDAFVLKGGTALKQCYSLDRFSEDIDLDGKRGQDIIPFIDRFCEKYGYSFRIAKNTETVKRCFVNYGNDSRPLKIETSYRLDLSDSGDLRKINGISVYSIDRLAQMKANAYASRDKIRDLYDLAFICKKHFNTLSKQTVNMISDAVANKGIEQFDYLLATQNDPLIDNDKLAGDFLLMNEKLGLLYDKDELGRSSAVAISDKKRKKDRGMDFPGRDRMDGNGR